MKQSWSLLRVLVFAATLAFWPYVMQGQQYVYTNNNIVKANSTTALKVGNGGALKVLKTHGTGGLGAGGQVYFGLTTIASAKTSAETCLFVSNGGDSTIAAFVVDLKTGRLRAVKGSPFGYGVSGAQAGGIGLAANKSTFLFAGNSTDNSISVLRISPHCGLTPGHTFRLSGSPDGMKVTPDGNYLIAAYFGGQADSFKIGMHGSLKELGPFSTQGATAGVDVSCDGRFAYFGDLAANTQVEAFHILAHGKLKELQNFTNQNGANSATVLMSADGKRLYVANTQSNDVMILTAHEHGKLTYEGLVKLNKPGMFTLGLTMGKNDPHIFLSEQGNPEAMGVVKPRRKTLVEVPNSPFHVIDNDDNPASAVALPAFACP